MAIRSIIVASACAGAAALALNWGLTSLGPSESTVEVAEVPERAWRVEVEEVSNASSEEASTPATQAQ